MRTPARQLIPDDTRVLGADMDSRSRMLPSSPCSAPSSSAFRVVAPSHPHILPSNLLAPNKAIDPLSSVNPTDAPMPSFDRMEVPPFLAPSLFPGAPLPWSPHPACVAQLLLRNRAASLHGDQKNMFVESLNQMGPGSIHFPVPQLGKKLFGCPQCRYMTDRKNNLKRHISTMHQDCSKPLECCGVVFKNKALLRDHVLIFHSNGYMCRFCGRNFCRKALLKRHLSVHSGQKDFMCSHCDYATSHKSNLERHRRVHDRQPSADDDDDDDARYDLLGCSSSSPHTGLHTAYTCAPGCGGLTGAPVGVTGHYPFYKSPSTFPASPYGLYWGPSLGRIPAKPMDSSASGGLSSPSSGATRVATEHRLSKRCGGKRDTSSPCQSEPHTDINLCEESSTECIDVEL